MPTQHDMDMFADKRPKLDAYYSRKMEEMTGHSTLLTRVSDGEMIRVTEVIPCGRKPLAQWEDLVFVGEVFDER
jgi:hypothetical protein